jgi:hypothetical protein
MKRRSVPFLLLTVFISKIVWAQTPASENCFKIGCKGDSSYSQASVSFAVCESRVKQLNTLTDGGFPSGTVSYSIKGQGGGGSYVYQPTFSTAGPIAFGSFSFVAMDFARRPIQLEYSASDKSKNSLNYEGVIAASQDNVECHISPDKK